MARRLVLSLTLAGAGFAWWSAAAAADSDPVPVPADISAIAVYVETIPAAGGAQAVGNPGTGQAELPPSVERQVREEGGEDAQALELVATSEAYGAPQTAAPEPPAPAQDEPLVVPTRKPPARESLGRSIAFAVETLGGAETVARAGALLAAATLGVVLLARRRREEGAR